MMRPGCREDLDRDDAPEPRIARAVDLAHPALAQRAEHLIRAERRASAHANLRSSNGCRLELRGKPIVNLKSSI
jgi:hypothetical protein